MNTPTNSESQELLDAQPVPTVLLVDDDPRLLRGLTRSFESEPFDVLTAISPAEGTAILAREKVDLVMSDNLMAGTLGVEFLEEVRKEFPSMKLMMLSGFMPPAAAERAKADLGVIQVLLKPCDAVDVAAAIREALWQEEYV